ncbi:thiol reductant ABC exporter subunit CydD [Nocardioides sp. zg-579]|uniref:Thiol reductant ABC exporter subunit CydD n=1 Tax=Nocardioides marmotae TaxID=2663857 RepID=A0A6I3JH34_9ACTN|nr:thiol reductant ABC exporter subunit CydD [Nocardioides marmotae]MCR6033605.1 thiol reductant ABC exporter subunit CydD [Gordonia jinghuaiqii]MTB97263.1 thiol reductant ABC exporter subunit CydD [Nocardioides marmotae]QKE01833.1 thiol reductant ABC exporter subunit CydD [Nocardioides marmotae]
MKPTDPRLRRQLAPARGQLAGVLASGLLGAVLVVAQAWVVTGLVVAVVREEPLRGWAVAVAVVLGLRALTGWAGDAFAARAAARVGTHLRRQVVGALLRRGRAEPGDAVLLTRGVSAAEPYLTRYLPAVVLAGVLPLLTLVVIATQDLLSAVIVAATLPLVPVFGALVGLATRDKAEEQWRAMAALSGHFLDVVRGLPTLVAYRRARVQSRTIARVTDRYRRASLGTLRVAFASSAILELVATLSVALVAVTVGVRLAHGDLGLTTALFVLLLAPEAYWPLRRVGAEFHAAAEGVATFEAVDALVSGTPEADPADRPAAGDLELDGITVTHPGRTVPAVASLTATVPARGVTVVTGPSGCGKSTLLATIAGLLARDTGSVSIDGRPVGGRSWQEQIAWLPQRPVFVAGTLADNLRLGTPDASDDQLWSALRRVALAERVLALPEGLDTPLGEDGLTLSAGERARLALARVLVADRPWVLLDEPTAHLDDLTEQVIVDTVAELGRTSGVVVVAHRPALLEVADHHLAMSAPAQDVTPAPAVEAAAAAPTAVEAPADPAEEDQEQDQPVGSLWPSTLVGALASASGVALTATAGWLIVQASTHPPVLTLMIAVVGVRAFGLARPVLRYAERLGSHDVALRLLARRRVEVYDALVPLTPGRLGRRRGDLLASVVDDVDGVVDAELRVRMPVRQAALVVLLGGAVATWLAPAAGLAITAFAAVAGTAAYLLGRHGAESAERAAVEHRAALSAAAVEVTSVLPELVMWQAGDRAADRVGTLSDRLGRSTLRSGAWSGAARAVVLAATGGSLALTAQVAAEAVGAGGLSGPMAALLVLLPLALADVLLPLADAGALSSRTDAAAARLHELEHRAPAVRATVATAEPDGHDVVVDHVRGGWDGARSGLHEVSFDVPPGARVGVVGPSGSGKSTLAALLLRFLDPAAGAIRLGGARTTDVAPDDVRRLVGLVDDDPHVFASTLVENVRFARPGASDAEVEDALRRARLGHWLDSLPDGLETWLGEGHAQVSGGERARIAVARSLLAAHPVLVLDEPTAHLDHATASELVAELLTGPRERSLVWITHDGSGLDLVDSVVDLGARPGAETPQRSRR